MAKRPITQRDLGLRRHRNAADALHRKHKDGTPCAWCGRPMYRDRTRNWDYNPHSTSPNSGKLHADHGAMTRAECLRRGLPIPRPDRLLHGTCNIQRGEGGNDHLAANARGLAPADDLGKLAMDWPDEILYGTTDYVAPNTLQHNATTPPKIIEGGGGW